MHVALLSDGMYISCSNLRRVLEGTNERKKVMKVRIEEEAEQNTPAPETD